MKRYILLAIMGVITFYSCNKVETYSDVAADVFVSSTRENNVDSYKAVFSAISYSKMTSVTVDGPNGSSVSLVDESGDGLSFTRDTTLNGETVSHVAPPAGIYTFHVNFADGSQKTYTNTLSSDILLPPVIDSLYRKPDGVSLRLKWKPVTGADDYQMRISCGHNEILPWMAFGSSTQLFYQQYISTFSPWLPGTITFEIRGAKHESDRNYMQAISYTRVNIEL
jgi:hypothetical protein